MVRGLPETIFRPFLDHVLTILGAYRQNRFLTIFSLWPCRGTCASWALYNKGTHMVMKRLSMGQPSETHTLWCPVRPSLYIGSEHGTEYKMAPFGQATVCKRAVSKANGSQACKPYGHRFASLVFHMASGLQTCKPISGKNLDRIWTRALARALGLRGQQLYKLVNCLPCKPLAARKDLSCKPF